MDRIARIDGILTTVTTIRDDGDFEAVMWDPAIRVWPGQTATIRWYKPEGWHTDSEECYGVLVGERAIDPHGQAIGRHVIVRPSRRALDELEAL